MKEFALIFRMDITTPEAQPTPQQMQEYMQQWTSWTDSIAANGQLVGGNHFSRQGSVLQSGRERLETPYIAENNSVAGYLIISATDPDDAIKIAQACPILNGENTSVEIREIATPGR